MKARPDWADALTSVLAGMRNQDPKPILPGVAYFSGSEISSGDLAGFLATADPNDAALSQLRLALAKWDESDSDAYVDADDRRLPPRSQERRARIYDLLGCDETLRTVIKDRAPVFEDHTTIISRTFEPWYRDSRDSRSTVYWDHYEGYLRDVKQWDAEAIASLDTTTTEVVERLSDPTRPEAKQSKGLVVGYVQSGKTANFTGVIAKAVDAGYRMVIVLTGTIEILRAQTQRRIDMELVGRENILGGQDPNDPGVLKELDYQSDEDWIADRFLKHGSALDQPNVPHIRRVTTHSSDYKRLPQGLSQLRFHRRDKSKPLNHADNLFPADAYVAVIKKNTAALNKLIKDLTPIQKDLADLPVLIIDDESDQASVDTTNPKKWQGQSAEERQRTAINKLISKLLKLCPRAQYVGYTATPFANVFIDPDDQRDLFPSDFLLSLRRPPGYMGVQEFHDVGKRWDDEEKTLVSSNELAHIRTLVGSPDTDPDRRDSELQQALDAFVLSGAIKKFRESTGTRAFKHHTMLVHESVKRADHGNTAAVVRDLWKGSAFTSAVGIKRLRRLWDDDFLPVMQARADGEAVPASFDELKKFIGDAVAEMTLDGDPVIVVNSDKDLNQQKKLDFEADRVWRILVGGTQLSRGFTVEGLTVSYFRRRTMQADTLMQAGRWFGFRPGYRDLVRLYIRRDDFVDLYEAFEALLMDEEAFRDELRQYEGFDEDGMPVLEPRQIPPLVSQHLPWLKPTARNKMWNAVIDSKATAKQVQDFYGHPDREADSAKKLNMQKFGLPLLQVAASAQTLPYELGNGSAGTVKAKVGILHSDDFVKLLGEMRWHGEYEHRFAPVKKFIEQATADGRIKDWAIVWPQADKAKASFTAEELGGVVPVIRRERREGRLDFIGSDAKHREAVMAISRAEPVPGIGASSTRGAVLVYLNDDRPKVDGKTPEGQISELSDLVVLMSLAMPVEATPRKRDLIRWTVARSDAPDEAAVPVDDQAEAGS